MVMPFPATGSDMRERHEQNLPRRRRVGDRGDPHPTNVYWSYGAHNLSNQYGDHYVFNNQYGGASMSLCTGYNGVGCHVALEVQEIGSFNLTHYNSVTLNR
jgi:hypothetical protein